MIDAVELLAVARDVNFPRVRVGRALVEGEERWRWAAGYAVPWERAEMLHGLERPLLLSTPGGRERVRSWVRAQRIAPAPLQSAADRRTWLAERVLAYGDPQLLPHVVEALARVPRFVADLLVSEVSFKLCGWSLKGWYGAGHAVDVDGRTPTAEIMVCGHDSDEEVVTTVLHELGHAFTAALPSNRPLPSITGSANVHALAVTQQWAALPIVGRERAANERLASALATIWMAR